MLDIVHEQLWVKSPLAPSMKKKGLKDLTFFLQLVQQQKKGKRKGHVYCNVPHICVLYAQPS